MVEAPHIEQIGDVKTFAKRFAEVRGKVGELLFSVFGAGVDALFMLNDGAADVPIGLHHCAVDRLGDIAPRMV